MYTNIWMRWYNFDLHILRCVYLWPTTSNGWRRKHLWKCSRKQFILWKRWNMVHLANRKPIIVMFNCDTVSVYCTNYFSMCVQTCTCILNHRKFMKVQPLHVPVDCITTLKNDKSYSWRDAISKWDAILLT